jgi:formate-dependent nitrite reductase membrane component NrfD
MVAAVQQMEHGGDGALGRPVYDAPHMTRPWGWKVSTYLWTKSIAAGALLIAALAALLGASPSGFMLGVAPPLVALLFLAITTGLLVVDLKRPDRFHYILLKGNPRSWLVWGAWILMAYGLVAVVWLLGARAGADALLRALAVPTMVLAAGAAGYSALLFGQAEGRDFWQSPLLLPQLLLAALAAGAAALLMIGVVAGAPEPTLRRLVWILAGSLVGQATLLFAELGATHTNVDVARAARLVTRGHFRGAFWGGVVAAGVVAPLVLLGVCPAGGALVALAGALALVGLLIYEDVWIKAGQSVPLS